MPYLNAGKVRIHYHTFGEGEPIVFIPGLCGDLYNWRRMVPMLEDRYHIVLMDNRGSGLTEAPDMQFNMGDMADDVSDLMSGLGFSRYHVLGWSMGGNVAQELAIRHPNEVISLILMSTYTRRPDRSSYAIDAMLNSVAEGASIHNFMQMMNTWCLTQSHYAGRRLIPKRLREGDEVKMFQGFIRQKRALDDFDSSHYVHLIRCPTLVIHGEEDIMVPHHMGIDLAGRILDNEIVIIPNAGHIIPPENCSSYIRAFLARHSVEISNASSEQATSLARD
ncbi:MAG: alpha/beta hydrolase [Euryarchaeota archaeon]|nr:alpha/beta hydrolase [Euryarchaeota archaeon]